MPADDQRELHAAQRGQKRLPPTRRAFGSWRQVAGAASAGVAKAHRDDGEERGVIELLRRDAQPTAQPLAAGVVEGNARLVHLAPGCLGGDEDAGRGMKLEDGARAQRQMLGAQTASPHVGQQWSDASHVQRPGRGRGSEDLHADSMAGTALRRMMTDAGGQR